MPVNASFSSPSQRKIYSGSEKISLINTKFQEFLQRTENHKYSIATAYPGFDDSVFDELDGFGENGSHNAINFDDGRTFQQTFDLALSANPNIIQLGTWNDYKEDTVIEPSVSSLGHNIIETGRGYSSLEYVQKRKNEWANIGWTTEDLRAPAELYNLDMSPALTPEQAGKIKEAYEAIFRDDVQTFRNIAASLISYNNSSNPILRAEITTAKLEDGTSGIPYSAELKASGTKPFVWSLTSGKLPDGLDLDKLTGKISGVPEKSGTSKFMISASLSGSFKIEQKFTLTIAKADLGITTSKLKNGTINKKYKVKLKASMSTPLSWTVQGLPEGLAISYQASQKTAEIIGVPEQVGTFNVIIKASNSYGSFTKNFTLAIKNVKPQFTTKKLPNASTGEKYSAKIKASGGEANDPLVWSLSWSNSNTIKGLKFKNNLIHGNPSTKKKGNYKVKTKVSNSAGSVSKTFTIKLNSDNAKISQQSENIFASNEINHSFKNEKTSSAIYIPAFELGIVSVDESGQYDFDIILSDDIPAKSKLIWRANSSSPSSDDEIAEFYDEDGELIERVPDNKSIIVSSWLNKGVIYEPVILIEVGD